MSPQNKVISDYDFKDLALKCYFDIQFYPMETVILKSWLNVLIMIDSKLTAIYC